MRRIAVILVPLAIAGAFAYQFRVQVRVFAAQSYQRILPCGAPLSYSLGTIDPRFKLSREDALSAIASASAVWEKAAGKKLFEYRETGGTIVVDLIYDDRQATSEKLHSLGIFISDDRSSYDAVKAEYTKLYAAYSAKKKTFETASAALSYDVAAYQAEVARVNARGGATAAEYQRLQAEKAAILARQRALEKQQASVNADADEVNSMVRTLNRLANAVNADASTYNETAKASDAEFQEAVFESAPGSESIHVYEFDSRSRLVRVLAHEFGHALGLEHVDDPAAIMYRLNQSTNATPTKADLAELHRVCSALR